MTFSSSDLPHIRLSLLTFLIVLGVGASAVFLIQKMTDSAQKARQTAQQQLTEARNKFNAARDDRDNLSTYAAEYDSWVKLKVIGEERRLDLIEGLEALRKQNHVLDFKYTVAPQTPYAPVPPVDSGNFDLKQSKLTIQLDLLHEEQLVNFSANMRSSLKGWFMLDSCSIERAAASAGSSVQLKAECAGGWLTLKNRNAK